MFLSQVNFALFKGKKMKNWKQETCSLQWNTMWISFEIIIWNCISFGKLQFIDRIIIHEIYINILKHDHFFRKINRFKLIRNN